MPAYPAVFRRSLALLAIVLGIAACSEQKPARLSPPLKAEYISRGRELVRGLAACGFCHGAKPDPNAPLSGGRAFTDLYGEVIAPNITPAKSGIGDWSTDELIAFFRSGKRPDEEASPAMTHRGYEWMSEEDLLSVVGYLRSLAPIENETPQRTLSFVQRNTKGFLETQRVVSGYVPEIPLRAKVEYGQYLVDNVARCGACHNAQAGFMTEAGYLVGGQEVHTPDGDKVAPDITNSPVYGIGEWSESQIVEYLRSGITPSEERSDPLFCPTPFFRNASAAELQAIAAFLKSVTP